MRLCHGCLCELQSGSLPLCEGCYSEILTLSINDRTARIAEIMKAMQSQSFHDSIVSELARFVDVLQEANTESKTESREWWQGDSDDIEDGNA